ncbi:MAG TPA: DUF5777 family beta-barrel protein [Thermoanaerobaculia bacterium]|nr:DUF5777 family beta-barrel protein [Thermoanaerobaculia bacterium]
MIKRFTLALLLVTTGAFAQSQYTPAAPLPLGDVLLSLPTAHIPSNGTYEVKFTHRFNQSIDEGGFSDQVHSLFGLDTNADVAFGVSWVLRRDLQLSVIRSNTNDTLETAAKYVVVQQAPAVPFSLAVRGGADWRTEKDLDDRVSFFAQAIVSRRFGRRAEVFALPTFVTKAGRAVNGDTAVALFDHVFNIPLGAAVMIRPNLAVVAELTPPNQDLPDGMNGDPAWAIGIKRAIGGHWFELLLTNSQSTLTDQAVASTFQGSPLNSGDLHIGFNIERRFGRPR